MSLGFGVLQGDMPEFYKAVLWNGSRIYPTRDDARDDAWVMIHKHAASPPCRHLRVRLHSAGACESVSEHGSDDAWQLKIRVDASKAGKLSETRSGRRRSQAPLLQKQNTSFSRRPSSAAPSLSPPLVLCVTVKLSIPLSYISIRGPGRSFDGALPPCCTWCCWSSGPRHSGTVFPSQDSCPRGLCAARQCYPGGLWVDHPIQNAPFVRIGFAAAHQYNDEFRRLDKRQILPTGGFYCFTNETCPVPSLFCSPGTDQSLPPSFEFLHIAFHRPLVFCVVGPSYAPIRYIYISSFFYETRPCRHPRVPDPDRVCIHPRSLQSQNGNLPRAE
jgi:hypothetical protein